jgi:hypothetical protein
MDAVNSWVVVEWRLDVFGTTDRKVSQQWIGVNGAEGVSFTETPRACPATPRDCR